MHGVKIHNGRSWWRLSQVWRKFAVKSTWLRFQKMHFRPGTKTVLAITPSRGFRGRQRLIPGTKWMSLPILQPSSVFLSHFYLRVLSDTSGPVGAAASVAGTGCCLECETFVACLQGSTWKIDLHTVWNWLAAWQKTTIVSICVRLQVWTVISATSQLLEHWQHDPSSCSLGILKLHLGMLQRTKDDP